MTDYRTPRGATARPLPRDTAQVLEELGLPPHALAREVRRATSPWTEQIKLIPIYLMLAGGFAAGAVKWNRSVSDVELAARVGEVQRAAEVRARGLELELGRAERALHELQLQHSALRVEAERRLGNLEARPRRR